MRLLYSTIFCNIIFPHFAISKFHARFFSQTKMSKH